jgi:hypothetical protein
MSKVETLSRLVLAGHKPNPADPADPAEPGLQSEIVRWHASLGIARWICQNYLI